MSSENTVVFPRNLATKFILLYKELPCLWNKKCKSYRQRFERHDAITKLTKLVREYDPSATRVHVMRKIESLRACARREHRRIRDSRNNGAGIYVPQLWYYDLISFVFGEEKSVTIKQSTSEPEDEEPIDDEAHAYEQPEVSYQDTGIPTSMIEITNNIQRQFGYEEDHTSKRPSGIQDEYDAIGINVAAKLRSLPQNTRIIAEKLINDVMFQAQINGLNASTFISTPDPFKHDNIM